MNPTPLHPSPNPKFLGYTVPSPTPTPKTLMVNKSIFFTFPPPPRKGPKLFRCPTSTFVGFSAPKVTPDCGSPSVQVVKYFHVCVVSGERVAAPPEEDMLNLYCKLRAITSPPQNWNFFLALNLLSLVSTFQVKRIVEHRTTPLQRNEPDISSKLTDV